MLGLSAFSPSFASSSLVLAHFIFRTSTTTHELDRLVRYALVLFFELLSVYKAHRSLPRLHLSPSFIQTPSFRTSQPSSLSQQQRPNQQYQQQPKSTFDVSSLAQALQQPSSSSPATTSAGWASSFLQQQGQQLGRSMDQRQRDEMNRVYQSVRRGGAEGGESLVGESDEADDRAHRPLPPVRLWQVSIGGTTFYTLSETTQRFSCFLRIM